MSTDKTSSSSRLASFSPDGRYFAVISSDSTLEVWDTKSGKSVANWKDEQDADSSVDYSCISCFNSGKKRKKDQKLPIIAFGTKTGVITAVNLLSNKKIWSNIIVHNGEVVSLHFSQNGESIYTAGTDGILCELNSENGELKNSFKASKKPINSLSISHNEKFACVASKISRIFNLGDKTELVKIPSQFGSPQQIALTDQNVVCSYENEEIQVFNLDPEKKYITESFKLSMKNQPKMLSNLNNCFVLSVSIKNEIYVWNLENMNQSEAVKIKIGSKKAKKKTLCEIISAKLCELKGDNKCVSVIVAYSFMDSVQFEIIEIKNWGEEIFINSEENTHQIDDGDKIKKEKGKKRTSSQFDPEKEENHDEIKINETSTEINNPDEPTMEEKLASLNMKNVDREKNVEREIKVPSADSVHVLLKQALHADDHSLLLDCIYTRDEKVINKSISLLNPADVIKLLKFFVIMSQSRGAVMVCVLPWLKSLIGLKASSIVSHDSSFSLLNSLFQLIDSRVSTFGMALQLSTCIDFNFSSIDDDETEEQFEAPIIYEDKDSDDEEDASRDSMETDNEEGEVGNYENAPEFSDGSEVMSD
ncbi:hypothetical protein LUZ60_004915 [Juncus effusus]|nr:hypothetical protein LUZ60_004915 [Juncus effusus]